MKRTRIEIRSLLLSLLVVAALSNIARAEDSPAIVGSESDPVRVACIGDSITAGSGAGRGWDFPSQLGRMLGPKWRVRNFGVGGSTMMNAGDKPYQKQGAFQRALKSRPRVVLIMLGTNDTKPKNWAHKADFYADARQLIESFEALDTKPRIYLCYPCPVPGAGNYGINEAGVEEEIPVIDALAKEKKLTIINVHEALAGHPDLFPDRVHPNNEGATLVAEADYQALTGEKFEGAAPPPAPRAPDSK